MTANGKLLCHIVGLVLNALSIIGEAGRKHKISDSLSVQPGFVKTAGGDIESRPLHRFVHRQLLPETIHGIAQTLIHFVVSGDPSGTPILRVKQTRFKKRAVRPISGLALFIPQHDPPIDPPTGFEHAGINDPRHAVGFHFSAVPDNIAAALRHDAVSGLLHAALTVPEKAGVGNVDAQGVMQIFSSQSDRFHRYPSGP